MLWRKDCVTSQKNVCVGGYIPRDLGADDPVRYLRKEPPPPPPPPTHCNSSEGRKVVCNQKEYSHYNYAAFFQTSLASLKLCLTKILFVFSKRTKIKVSFTFRQCYNKEQKTTFWDFKGYKLVMESCKFIKRESFKWSGSVKFSCQPSIYQHVFFIYFPGQTFRSLYMIILRG